MLIPQQQNDNKLIYYKQDYKKISKNETAIKTDKSENIMMMQLNHSNFFSNCSDKNIINDSFKKLQLNLSLLVQQKNSQRYLLNKDFEDCFQVCNLVWQNQEVNIKLLNQCSWLSLVLIQSIIFRKFKAYMFINTPETLFICLRKLLNKNLKRKDEMIKQGLVLFFNVLSKINKKQNNFYQYFYKNYMKNFMNKKIYEKFFYISHDKPNKIYIRKVNRILIKLLSQNKNIKMIIKDLNFLGLKLYEKQIQKQLRKIVFNLQNKLIQSLNLKDFQTKLSQFENGSQTDIPWTIYEIQKAINYLKDNVLEY